MSRLTPLVEACEAAPLDLAAAEALRSAAPGLARGNPPAGLEALYARSRAALLRVPPEGEVAIAQQLTLLAAACDAAPTDAAAAEQLRRLLETAGVHRWGGDTGSRAVLKAVHEHARAALWRAYAAGASVVPMSALAVPALPPEGQPPLTQAVVAAASAPAAAGGAGASQGSSRQPLLAVPPQRRLSSVPPQRTTGVATESCASVPSLGDGG